MEKNRNFGQIIFTDIRGYFKIQLTLVISTLAISNNLLSRRENPGLILT